MSRRAIASFLKSCSSRLATRRAFFAVASALRSALTSVAKSGEATVASVWPRATRAPTCTSSRATGPEIGASTWVAWF